MTQASVVLPQRASEDTWGALGGHANNDHAPAHVSRSGHRASLPASFPGRGAELKLEPKTLWT